jgi:hypothetical protein
VKLYFFGSDKWTGNFSKEPAPLIDSKYAVSEDPESSKRISFKGNRFKIPFINLLINFLISYVPGPVPVMEGSPWNHYLKIYGLKLGGFIAVVCKIPAIDELFIIRSFSLPDVEKKFYMLR